MEENRLLGRRERDPNSLKVFVSLFRDYETPIPIDEIGLAQFLLSSTYKKQIEELRRCSDNARRREFKSKLPAITPSGVFSKRCNAGLIQHSGMICIDIDGKDNPGINDWEVMKSSLSDLPGLWYAGLSASGNGLFLLFKVKSPEKHTEHFNALARDLHERGIVVDYACKDVSRLRGASYDPNPLYYPSVALYESLLTTSTHWGSGGNTVRHRQDTPKSVDCPNSSDNGRNVYRVGKLIDTIERTGANIADYYPDWFAIGRSLASEFGESGRSWFHSVSSKSQKYKPKECNQQYTRCLRSCSKTSIRTFFYYCKQNGITTT